MCGFAGFFVEPDLSGVVKEVGEDMALSLSHRGGDGFGVNVTDGVCLVHNRLAIVDLTSAAHQPMVSHCGDHILAYNGEIYNHMELRAQLELDHHKVIWRSDSDTETLLESLIFWGVHKTLEKIIGMFSFAFYSKRERIVTLARDRLGEKPLYWGWVNGTFLFGSELQALKRHPRFLGDINRDALALLVNYGYVPAPHSIYQGIEKLQSGHFVQIKLGGRRERVFPRTYWSLEKTATFGISNSINNSSRGIVDTLEKTITEAVAGQLMGDVPIGTFLSGGIDSSLITALMQKVSDHRVMSFTIGFDNPAYNEAHHARQLADHLGTDHSELYVGEKDALDVIGSLPDIYSEPFADSSQIPMVLVSRLAKERVTVALSGDGGDELFGGYTPYKFAPRLWSGVSKMPLPLRQLATKILMGAPLPAKIEKGIKLLSATDREDFYRLLQSHWVDPSQIVIGAKGIGVLNSSLRQPPTIDNYEHWMMAADAGRYMVDDILTKVDRAAMHSSLETRVPLLDHRVVELSWKIPLSMKINNGVGKWILREVLARHVPREYFERPKKGFSVPLGQWLRGPLRDWAESLLDERRLSYEGYFSAEPVRAVWAAHLSGKRDYSRKLWAILMFQAWLEVQ
jgi:asparagine synthase (glutamine-hydrolysing)